MKKLLTILFVLIGFASAAQWTPMRQKYQFPGIKITDSLHIPTDTTTNKTGIARIGSTLYAGNGTKWTAAAGSGTTGIDSVTITSTGCVKTFSTWSGGTESVIGTVTQPNGLAPGTGIATKTTGTTFTVTAATYTINCITYQSRDTTITLTAAGDTGRIDVIKVNTSGVTTQGTGTEGDALALPSLSATELALTYVLVTDTGVTVSLPTDTALWVSVGTSIRNANTGPVNVRTHLQIGTYTPGSWLTSGAHTNTYFVAQDGFYVSNPSNNSLNKTGIAQGFGNAFNWWAGGNIVGKVSLIGNSTGNQISALGGYNPASGGGFVSTYSSNTTLNPTGANSINYTVFDAVPTYTQGVLGTGALRGFWYRPSVASLNTSRNIAIETMSGDIIHRNLAGSGTRMVVANDSGLLSTQAIPGGGGGATTLEEAFINGNVFTQTNRIAAQGNSLYVDSTNEFKVHSQYDRGDASQITVKTNAVVLRAEGTGIAHNIEVKNDRIGFSGSDSVNIQMNPPVSAVPDFALGMVGDRVYRIPVSSTGSTPDTIFVDAPLEAYTSGDSNKIRINPDTLVKWRYGLEKTFTGIDLASADYDITEPGIYLIEHGSSDGSHFINLPDPDSFIGGKITIINADGADNYSAPYGSNAPKRIGGSTNWVGVEFQDVQILVSIGSFWRGGVVVNY